jgi:MFS family permease
MNVHDAAGRSAEVDVPVASPLGIRAVLRIPDFRRVWAAQAVSDLGDGLTNLTLLIVAVELTGSTAAVAAMAIALALPAIVVGPVAGVFVDRWDRRRVMLASDLVRAVIVLGFIGVGSADQLWLLVLLAIAHASVSTFFAPARMALVPRIVPEAGLMAANSLAQITRVIATVVGASAAGVLVGVVDVFWPAFVADSLTFALSFVVILGVRTSGAVEHGQAEATQVRVGRALREGLHLVARSRLLLGTMVAAAVTMLGIGAVNVLFVPLFVQELDLPTTWLGLVDIAQTSSMILAAGLTATIAARARPTTIITVGLAAIAVCVGLIGGVDSVWQIVALLFLAGWFVTPLQAAIATIVQIGVADEQRGRVGATVHAVVSAASVVSMALAGLLGDVVGIRPGFYIAGVVVGLAALMAAVVFRGQGAAAPEPARALGVSPARLDAIAEEAQ